MDITVTQELFYLKMKPLISRKFQRSRKSGISVDSKTLALSSLSNSHCGRCDFFSDTVICQFFSPTAVMKCFKCLNKISGKSILMISAWTSKF